MARPAKPAMRSLAALAALLVALYGVVTAGTQLSDAEWTPKRALDLAGGTQIVLEAVPDGANRAITPEDISQAIGIIRQRVNSSGISEAEVSSQGSQNIVVELPGDPEEQQQAIELVSQSAQMRFRPVLVAAAPGPLNPDGTPQAPADDSGLPTTIPGPAPSVAPGTPPADGAEPPASPSPTTQGRAVPRALVAQPSDPAVPDPAAPVDPAVPDPAAPVDPAVPDPAAPVDPAVPDPAAPVDPAAPATPDATAGTPSDLAQITPEIQAQFTTLDCSDPANLTGGLGDDPEIPLVTCEDDGSAKYILGPVEVEGLDIDTATSGLQQNSQGNTTGEWAVQLDLNGDGARAFRTVTERLVSLTGAQNQFAIVLDGLVVSAPTINTAITDGNAEISGSFTQETATALANQLKFGALPISFEVQTQDQISPLLGSEQLRNGLLAGLVGLALVCVFSLFQYRALGLVTIASLLIAGILTYGLLLLLSWTQGYRLSLPGVAGVIVAIGVTADSFIVYFERVRDEVREGRSLVAAVEAGWGRARRTIVISDVINLLAAVVLYVLAVGGVRGFAFTLGLTTLVDLLVVVLFTHPVLTLMARTRFFGGGHRLSGFDAEHLGRTVAYAGRGRVRTPGVRGKASAQRAAPLTIAERKALEAKEKVAHTGSHAFGTGDEHLDAGDEHLDAGVDDPGRGSRADLTKAGSSSSSSTPSRES